MLWIYELEPTIFFFNYKYLCNFVVKIKEKRIRIIENENLSNFFLVLKFFILSLFLSVYKTWEYIQHTKKEKKMIA